VTKVPSDPTAGPGPEPVRRTSVPKIDVRSGSDSGSSSDRDAADHVERFQRGDAEGFVHLYKLFHAPIESYLTGKLSSVEEARDVAQLVFLKVFEALPSYRLDRQCPVRHWLYTIARNAAEDHRRRQRGQAMTLPEDIDLYVRRSGGVGPLWGSASDVHSEVEELPLVQRQALVLLYRWRMTARETAEVLGRNEAAVRQLHSRALATVRIQLAPS
jgi:RNA polymerase sigma-70 factor (ECF subfamily)